MGVNGILQFSIFKYTIIHLVYLRAPPPPQKKMCAFDFSWDDCNIQMKLKAMVMQNLEAGSKVLCGLCENSGCFMYFIAADSV